MEFCLLFVSSTLITRKLFAFFLCVIDPRLEFSSGDGKEGTYLVSDEKYKGVEESRIAYHGRFAAKYIMISNNTYDQFLISWTIPS